MQTKKYEKTLKEKAMKTKRKNKEKKTENDVDYEEKGL